jgi:hypothetical protein
LPKGHRFAGHLYGYLSRHHTVEESVARARYALLSPDEAELTPVISRDWHLARLYFGRQGGGKLSSSEKARQLKHEEYGHKEFLNTKDKSVPVASRREFVGRRRQIQTILRHFRIRKYAGVLIHGFGRQGKSSLAARRDITPTLLRSASERCEQIGEMKEAHSFIVHALESFNKAKKEGKDISDTNFAAALLT